MKNCLLIFGGIVGGVLVVTLVLLETPSISECDVAYVPLRGVMTTYLSPDESSSTDATASEDVTYAIDTAESDPSITAIILAVDSPGGSPVAGEEIAFALKRSAKPTVALIRDMGDSAAYLAATGADKIFASAFSDVGSIGITSSYLDQSQYNKDQGYTYNQLSIGAYKDMFDPEKMMTSAEKALVMQQLDVYYQQLLREIATNRKLAVDEIKKLSDGRSYTGSQALESKLIDEVGGIQEVREYLNNVLGYAPTICSIDI